MLFSFGIIKAHPCNIVLSADTPLMNLPTLIAKDQLNVSFQPGESLSCQPIFLHYRVYRHKRLYRNTGFSNLNLL